MASTNDLLLKGIKYSAYTITAGHFVIFVLMVVFNVNCLSGRIYSVQAAREFFLVVWLSILAILVRPENMLEKYFKMPKSLKSSFIFVGFVDCTIMLVFFSSEILTIYEQGDSAIDLESAGRRCSSLAVSPTAIYYITMVFNGITGGMGIAWALLAIVYAKQDE